MKGLPKLFAITVLGIAWGTSARADAVFDFDNLTAFDTVTPFSDTNNGVTASFSSPADPGAFGILDSANFGFVSPISGNVLVDPGPAGANNIPLDVAFSQAFTSISLDFATNSTGPANLTLTALANNVFVGSMSVSSAVPSGGFFPQGSINFSNATPFDSIQLISDAPDFAVDNIRVSAGAVPEPSSMVLCSLGIVMGLGYEARRRLAAA